MAIEIKRRGEIDGVEQLTRYLELLNRDPLLAPVRGVFAAQEIKPQARVLAAGPRHRLRDPGLRRPARLRRRRHPPLLAPPSPRRHHWPASSVAAVAAARVDAAESARRHFRDDQRAPGWPACGSWSVGAGVVGLTCAVRLAEAGHDTHVLARDLPLETTSAVAAAIVVPLPRPAPGRGHPVGRPDLRGARPELARAPTRSRVCRMRGRHRAAPGPTGRPTPGGATRSRAWRRCPARATATAPAGG